jgi:hypothetical protein
VQSRRAARDETVAEIGHNVETKRADRSRVIAVAFELLPDPARNLGAARIGESCELGKAPDRHDARNDRHFQPHRFALVDEMKVGIGVEEILRDRRVRAGFDLAPESVQVLLRASRLRVVFGVRGDFDEEVTAELLPDEFHELICIMELTGRGGAGRQVASQRDEVSYAVAFVLLQDLANARTRRTHAGNVRRRGVPRFA